MRIEPFFGMDYESYGFINIDEAYGDEVPVRLEDYREFDPENHYFEWYDGIYREFEGNATRVAIVRMPCLENGELPPVARGFVEHVLAECVGGGSNWWGHFFGYKPEELEVSIRLREQIREGGKRLVEFEEGLTVYRVDYRVIQRGVKIILSGETDVPLEVVRMYARDWTFYHVDSVEADLILQVGLFGRRVFG